MSFLDEVRAKRRKLADVLLDEDYSGIRELVEELYPDKAHFIYELLQNAEDVGATEAVFRLHDDFLTFEHDGEAFTQENVWGITNIGKGTKRAEEDKIGRFGIGFKAVFAYTEAPRIWSPTYCFEITNLVLPAEISRRDDLGKRTRFEFPFNNSKKGPLVAHAEVLAGLNELAETTLLFLSHLKSIEWHIGQKAAGKVSRIQHPQNHVQVQKEISGKTTTNSHFLCFSDSVQGLERRHISVAFELEHLLNVTAFDPTKELASQLKIVAANPGRVAVFFPAGKETSGLRFHLHAPFVPEVSRASIKETSANGPLFELLAKLAAASLHTIRSLNLLTGDFLGVLPNPADVIPPRYQPIRAAIVAEMNDHPLTPTYSKSHAPAKHLLQARASLKDWLSLDDIEFLVDYDGTRPQWAIAASLKSSNADRFLDSLAIKRWDIQEFIEVLKVKSLHGSRCYLVPPYIINGPDPEFMKWLTSRPLEWHQQMYALLCADIQARDEYHRVVSKNELRQLRIIRLGNGQYNIGENSFFPAEDTKNSDLLPRVDPGVYSSGKSKTVQDDARKFLELMGVREVSEADQVSAILKQRYSLPNFHPDIKDIDRFICLWEKDDEHACIFRDYYIFKLRNQKWGKPSQVYLDAPFLETGLCVFFEALGAGAAKFPLAVDYSQSGVQLNRFLSFAVAVGVQTTLETESIKCEENPAVKELVLQAPGGWSANYGINKDCTIIGLKELLSGKNEALSRLIWRMACERKDKDWLQAQYRNNSNYPVRTAPSQLVLMLRESAWIPQNDGVFVCPSKASRTLLPKGFPYDAGYQWLKEILFGQEEQESAQVHSQTETAAKELGFPDKRSLERAKRFATIYSPEDQERILAEYDKKSHAEFPRREPSNPERRIERVQKMAEDSPDRLVEQRQRAVSVGLEEVKMEAEEYLRDQYSNPDGEMFCQICQTPLPFKLDDGRFYFEKVEFLPELVQRHYQNYLALCPNHAAMFQHANGSRETMKQSFASMEGLLLDVVLARSSASIRFTRTHAADLKAVIDMDRVPKT